MDTYEENLRVILKQNQFIEQLSGKTILLTGATGMIGKCIIDLLMQFNDNCFSEQKIRVIALSRNSENARRRLDKHWTKDCLHYYSFDVNTGIPECERADYVIHAASNTHPLQLRGARGNSGVILSLLFRGLSKGLKGYETAGAAEFAAAMQEGVSSAYKAVMKPAEGTDRKSVV